MELTQTVRTRRDDGNQQPAASLPSDLQIPRRRSRSVLAAIVGMSLLTGTLATATPAPADQHVAERAAELLIRGARVITMDPARPVATAVAVRQGTIVYVGDDAGAESFVGPHTRIIAGRPNAAAPGSTDGATELTVLPGLIDAHAHLVGLGLSLAHLELRGLRSPAEIVTAVQAQVKKDAATAPEWLQGRSWDQNRFTPQRFPTAADRQLLDAASGSRPVFLRRVDGHAGWANAEALRRAGVTRDTEEVSGGFILRDETGEPTGVLIDHAMSLVERVIPPPTPAEIEQAILTASTYVTARGLTTVHEMGIDSATVAVYRRLAEEQRLPLRVYAFHDDPIPHNLAQLPFSLAYKAELDRLTTRLGPPESRGHFSLRGIKLYMDGALGSRGAALWEPYSDEPSVRGLLLAPPEHIEAMARWAMLHGYQVATHAIGDRANQLVLDAYQHAGVRADRNVRFRVEHAQVLNAADLAKRRYQSLGVIASIQPTHATSDMEWAPARLGPVRLPLAYAWQSLLHSGARICAGSDFPVEEADPRLGLHAAVLRQDLAGNPPGGFMADQRLSVGEAIRAFTTDAAYAGFAENQLGLVATGRPADLTVLAGHLELAAAGPLPHDLATRAVLLTLIDGYPAYDALAKSAPNLAERSRSKSAAATLRGKSRRLARLGNRPTGG